MICRKKLEWPLKYVQLSWWQRHSNAPHTEGKVIVNTVESNWQTCHNSLSVTIPRGCETKEVSASQKVRREWLNRKTKPKYAIIAARWWTWHAALKGLKLASSSDPDCSDECGSVIFFKLIRGKQKQFFRSLFCLLCELTK